MDMDAFQRTANLPSLEEQVASLQALLEATRRVHSTIAVDEVLLGSAQIVVRELEMEGALLISPEAGDRLAFYGARNSQRSLLPKSMPLIPGYSLASRSVTCYEVGATTWTRSHYRDGSHLFIVADVSGKGLVSAIMATSSGRHFAPSPR